MLEAKRSAHISIIVLLTFILIDNAILFIRVSRLKTTKIYAFGLLIFHGWRIWISSFGHNSLCISYSVHIATGFINLQLVSSWSPETISMKGLTLNCMERKSEAYELVRLGLKVNLHCSLALNLCLILPGYSHHSVLNLDLLYAEWP